MPPGPPAGAGVRWPRGDDQLVLLVAADALHVGAPAARGAGHHADARRFAPVAEQRAVAERAGRGDPGRRRRVARQVPAEPGFAFGQERLQERARPCLRGSDARDGRDHPAAGIDGHPKAARPGGSSERVLEVAAGQPRAGKRLDGGDTAARRAESHRHDRPTGGEVVVGGETPPRRGRRRKATGRGCRGGRRPCGASPRRGELQLGPRDRGGVRDSRTCPAPLLYSASGRMGL